jgi:hypothetical protein
MDLWLEELNRTPARFAKLHFFMFFWVLSAFQCIHIVSPELLLGRPHPGRPPPTPSLHSRRDFFLAELQTVIIALKPS